VQKISFHKEVDMPVQLFTEPEWAWRNRFPEVIVYEDLVTFFTLSEHDLERMPRSSAPHNRLGYALQLRALRFIGFVPDDLSSTPPEAVALIRNHPARAAVGALGLRTREMEIDAKEPRRRRVFPHSPGIHLLTNGRRHGGTATLDRLQTTAEPHHTHNQQRYDAPHHDVSTSFSRQAVRAPLTICHITA
jgi:hypothetical protein